MLMTIPKETTKKITEKYIVQEMTRILKGYTRKYLINTK